MQMSGDCLFWRGLRSSEGLLMWTLYRGLCWAGYWKS